MNAAVQTHLTVSTSLAGRLSDSVSMLETVGVVAEEYAAAGANALGQATRAVVNDARTMGLAGDLTKAISAQLKAAETERKRLTKPLDDVKKAVMEIFTLATADLVKAGELMKIKVNDYGREQQRLAAEAAAAARKAAEEEALRIAEQQAAAGRVKDAEASLEQAARVTEKITAAKVEAKGIYGASVGGRKTVSGSVDSVFELLLWLVEKNDPAAVADLIQFKQAGLNDLARKVESGLIPKVPGLKVSVETNFVAR